LPGLPNKSSGKLRENNVINYRQVLAAVLEVNGKISVLKRQDQEDDFDPALLHGVLSKENFKD